MATTMAADDNDNEVDGDGAMGDDDGDGAMGDDNDNNDDDGDDNDDGNGANKGRYNPESCKFKRLRTEYLARPCTGCRKDTRDYCSCDPSIDLCSACFGAHRAQHCGKNNLSMNSW